MNFMGRARHSGCGNFGIGEGIKIEVKWERKEKRDHNHFQSRGLLFFKEDQSDQKYFQWIDL